MYGTEEADLHLSGFQVILMQDERLGYLTQISVSQIFGTGTLFSPIYSISYFI